MVQDHLRDVRRVIPDEMEELSEGLERRRGRRGRADVLPLEEEEPSLNEVLDAEEEAEEARTVAQDLDSLQRIDPSFVTDPVKLYLREIAQAALLNHEQEIALAKRVEEGDIEAVQTFVRSNLRLVVSIAKKYVGRGLSLLDLRGHPLGAEAAAALRERFGPRVRLS